jgi:DNA integrity scanning protein DisA with diadenylate cyclase activity
MSQQKISDDFRAMLDVAHRLAEHNDADAVLVMLEGPTDWEQLRLAVGNYKLLVAADDAVDLQGATEAGIETVVLNMVQSPVFEKLTQALLESVADEMLPPGADVVAVYSGFEAARFDSVSMIHLDEHFSRLTVRDIRLLVTRVPLDTLKSVVDLAVEIGREGREGKPIGTMFVVGSTKAVLERCHPAGFDPVKGYKKAERSLSDRRVREGIKEIAQMDGAFVISPDSTIMAAAQYVDASADGLTMTKGLGSRHWAAAAISRKTNAVAVTVSQSSGTVRIFQNGEVMLRIEPGRMPMKWKDFEFDPPSSE